MEKKVTNSLSRHLDIFFSTCELYYQSLFSFMCLFFWWQNATLFFLCLFFFCSCDIISRSPPPPSSGFAGVQSTLVFPQSPPAQTHLTFYFFYSGFFFSFYMLATRLVHCDCDYNMNTIPLLLYSLYFPLLLFFFLPFLSLSLPVCYTEYK